jgi:hypothetical protein
MINLEERKRGNKPRPSQFVYGLRCAVCNVELPPKLYAELPETKYDFCQEHKGTAMQGENDFILGSISRGEGYWNPQIPPPDCWLDYGIKNCFQCKLLDCQWNELSLWKEREPKYKVITPTMQKNGHKTGGMVKDTQNRPEAMPARNATFSDGHCGTEAHP